jgi:hypothetical protein
MRSRTAPIVLALVGWVAALHAPVCWLLLFALVTGVSSASAATEPADDSGRYSDSGFHDPANTEYIAAVDNTRSFFVFDLTNVTDPRPIVSTTLILETGTVTSGGFGGITYTLYDVSTLIETLVLGGAGLAAIYDDLGSGVPFSAATDIEPGTSGTDKSIPLLPAGVAAVEAAKGAQVAIGGGPTGLGGNFAFGGTNVSGARLMIDFGAGPAVELRDAELVAGGSPVLQNDTGTVRIEDARLGRLGPPVFVPEPGALWQLGSGIGLLALLARCGRRRMASDTGRTGAPRLPRC